MRSISAFSMIIFLMGTTAWSNDFAQKRLRNWPQWRGPEANGVAPLGNPPVHWDENTNIKWKVEVPGKGSASPIVWEDQIFILTAIKTDRQIDPPPQAEPEPEPAREGSGRRGRRGRRFGHRQAPPTHYYRFDVMSFDRATGKIRWQKTATEVVPHEGHHPSHGYASASPTTDGENLYVSFGSRGIYCYDLEGKLKWKRDLGKIKSRMGFGETITPVIHGDTLIVNWDQEGPSFIVALDAATGATRWKVDRDEHTSWNTPYVIEHDGRTQVITNGTTRVRSYDIADGELIWECGGQTTNPIPSVVVGGGVVYCMSGFRGHALFAIPLDSTGDLTDSDKIAWQHDRGTPYVPSPLLYGNRLFFTDSNKAILSCIDVQTGKPLIDRERMPDVSDFYASPVGAADRIYFVGRDGAALVIKNSSEMEVLATNRLDDPIDASPAIAGDSIFLRAAKHLYCIAEN